MTEKNKNFVLELQELRKFVVFSGDIDSTVVYASYFEVVDVAGVNFLKFISQEGCVAAFKNWWKVVDDCNVGITLPEAKHSSKSVFSAPGT
jgi:hypothetical protein